MKTLQLLKTTGLISALSLSSITLISCDGSSSSNEQNENFTIPISLNNRFMFIMNDTTPTSTLAFQTDNLYYSDQIVNDPFSNLNAIDTTPDSYVYQLIDDTSATLKSFGFTDGLPELDFTLTFTSSTAGTFSADTGENGIVSGTFIIN